MLLQSKSQKILTLEFSLQDAATYRKLDRSNEIMLHSSLITAARTLTQLLISVSSTFQISIDNQCEQCKR